MNPRFGLNEIEFKSWVPGSLSELLAFIFLTGMSVILALILVLTNGNILPAFAFIAVTAVFFLTFYRVDLGFYLFIGMVLSFDQFLIPGSDPITLKVQYFENLKQIPYIPHFSAGVMNPLEIQLTLLILAWFMAISFRRETRIHGVLSWGIALLFYCGLMFWLAYGLKRGGKFLPSLWEVRALFYSGLLYFFVPQVIQTKKQIHTLMWIAIFAITLKDVQGALRYIRYGFGFHGYTCLTNHEDPVFTNTLFILLIAMIVFDSKSKQRNALLWLLLPLLLGYLAGQRRAAIAGFFGCLGTFIIILPGPKRRIIFKALMPILLVFIVYCAAFWNYHGRLAMPVDMIKSGILEANKKDAGARYSSNLYRLKEDYDLAVTVRHFPVLGIGFGNKYMEPVSLPKIAFPLRDYIPHNEILWVIVKTGAVGFFIFWLFMDTLMFQGARIFRKLDDPYLKAVAAVAVTAVVNQMIVSYFDLQLTYYRDMIYLGTLVGLFPALDRLSRKKDYEPSRPAQLSALEIKASD